MKIIGKLTARMRSERFPGKVIAPLCGKPMVAWIIEQAKQIDNIDEVYLLTTGLKEDDILAETAIKYGITGVWRGPEKNLLVRHMGALDAINPYGELDLFGDSPIVQTNIVSRITKLALENPGYDYYHAFHTYCSAFGEGVGTIRAMSWYRKTVKWYEEHPEELPKRQEQYWNVSGEFKDYDKMFTGLGVDVSDIRIREASPIKTSIDYQFELHIMEYVISKIGRWPTMNDYKDIYRKLGPIPGTDPWW